MKRLIKWLLVCGIICCLLGAGTMTAGAVMGGQQGVRGVLSLLDKGQAWEDHWEERFRRSGPLMEGEENVWIMRKNARRAYQDVQNAWAIRMSRP